MCPMQTSVLPRWRAADNSNQPFMKNLVRAEHDPNRAFNLQNSLTSGEC